MRNRIIRQDLLQAIRKARKVARDEEGREICGLLVHNGHFIEIHETANIAEETGKFHFDMKQIKALKRAVGLLGHEIVGIFHSHPASEAKPGPGDLKGALDDSLMLIIDCIGSEALLWKIKDGKARKASVQTITV
jgi:[CysO sulfur-carrier protein]-S-L-cysteine hydrolase